MVRDSTGRPATTRYCFGTVSPLAEARSPRPAATTIAAMVFLLVTVGLHRAGKGAAGLPMVPRHSKWLARVWRVQQLRRTEF